MVCKKSYCPGLGVVLTIVLALISPFSAWAGGAQPFMVKKPPVLEVCAVMSDSELSNLRGRYDAYYFGLDIIVNLTGSGSPVTLTPHPGIPPETIVSPTGISFKDTNVAYQAGIGQSSVFQSVQVLGDGKLVTGVVNLNIMVPESLLTTGLPGISLPKESLTGLGFK